MCARAQLADAHDKLQALLLDKQQTSEVRTVPGSVTYAQRTQCVHCQGFPARQTDAWLMDLATGARQLLMRAPVGKLTVLSPLRALPLPCFPADAVGPQAAPQRARAHGPRPPPHQAPQPVAALPAERLRPSRQEVFTQADSVLQEVAAGVCDEACVCLLLRSCLPGTCHVER